MPFDDLDQNEDDELDAGGEALDGLAGSVSSGPSTSQETETDSEKEEDEDVVEYDPLEDPAFPSAKNRTQHSIYCLPDTWDSIDGSSGLLFETEIDLRRNGYENVQKRELHNALLAAAAEQLTAEDLSKMFVETREKLGPASMLEED